MIKEKLELISILSEIQIAATIMSDDSGVLLEEMNPLDLNYCKLRTDIDPVPLNSFEADLVRQCIDNTHSKRFHSHFRLEMIDLFRIEREGEAERFSRFDCLDNHKLMWHGSRVANFAGILSQGLRIAPPEAPHSGYMYGKGIYLADMVSKSAEYCHAHLSDNTILMLINEVALGNVHKEPFAKYLTKNDLQAMGKHSTHGLGRFGPDPSLEATFSPLGPAVSINLGREVETGEECELDHNEFIVYDEAQTIQRYLVKIRFVPLKP